MREFLSDAIERTGFAGLRVMNRACVPMELVAPTLDIGPDELLEMYPAESTFTRAEEPPELSVEAFRQRNGLELAPFRADSLYRPHPRFASVYDRLRENHEIRGLWIRLPAAVPERTEPRVDTGSAALVFCHGWAERSFGLELNLLFPAMLKHIPGLDIYALEEPYHMHRTPRETPYSGAFFFDNSPMGVVEAMRQAVSDASQLVATLRSAYDAVAVMGVSLGGHVTAYLATCDDRPDAFVACQAGMEHPVLEVLLRLAPCLARQVACVDEAASFHGPLRMDRFQPLASGERIITVHGAYDRLIAPESGARLRAHFGVRHPILYRGGHLSFQLQARSIAAAVMPRLAALLNT